MGIVKCSKLIKDYRHHRALFIEGLTIKQHSLTGLIGRNGAGKTTLLKLMAGFTRATSGEVKVFDEVAFDNLIVSANSIFIDDQLTFSTKFTLHDILKEMKHFYPNWDAQLAIRLCEYFELHEKQYHHHLSKGKKSTFNMIIGVAARTALTILDEPITGMDAAVRKDFYRLLLKDYLKHPRTIIVSSHHLNEMEDILEDVILLDEGEVVFHLPIDDVREYAVGIRGDSALLGALLKNVEILYEEQIGSELYMVIEKSTITEKIRRAGFQMRAVSPTDLAVYMTNKTKGGIDDVYRND